MINYNKLSPNTITDYFFKSHYDNVAISLAPYDIYS